MSCVFGSKTYFQIRKTKTHTLKSLIRRLLMSTRDGPRYEPSSFVPLKYSYVTDACTPGAIQHNVTQVQNQQLRFWSAQDQMGLTLIVPTVMVLSLGARRENAQRCVPKFTSLMGTLTCEDKDNHTSYVIIAVFRHQRFR